MMKYPNIEAERARMGYTRRQVADTLGVKRDTYCAWIEGEYPIPSNFCARLSMLLNCNLDYLLSADDENERWKRYRTVV